MGRNVSLRQETIEDKKWNGKQRAGVVADDGVCTSKVTKKPHVTTGRPRVPPGYEETSEQRRRDDQKRKSRPQPQLQQAELQKKRNPKV